ncbi:hypothetical protein [Streptomyces acidiscabies]|uniref:hypothetical protein n=1 Tax=Streptomyces acidiscabies TaxID=42234 RepID=UPI0009510252|nr:hypothetical protein [Streptomyces acidiscabies]
MEAVIVVVALVFLVLFLLGVWGTVKAVGAAKRSVDRTIGQARRTVEDHTLRAKSFGRLGPAGEIAQLRLTLRTSMRATQDALHAGVAEDESLKESLGLFERLSAHGHQLDDELKRLESDPDRSTLAQRLPELRERTERITASADALRWAARDRASRFAEDELDSLSAQIDVEAGALRHWTTDDVPQAGRSGQAGPAWQAGPEGASRETPAPAISPQPPRPAYPWEKKTRPESTT